MPHRAAFAVNYTDEVAYYERQQEAYMEQIEEDIAQQERQRIDLITLQAQARILNELDSRNSGAGGDHWLSVWIDLRTEINQKIKKLKA